MSDYSAQWSDESIGDSYDDRVRDAMEVQFEGKRALFGSQILNTRPDPIDHRDLYFTPSLTEVPPYNYGDETLQSDFEVRRQGLEGSCTGQALAAVIDLQNIKRYRKGAPVPKRVSARMAYESAKLYDHFPDDGLEGSSIRGAIKGFYHRGICGDKLSPYTDFDQNEWVFNKDIKDDARRVVLGAYFRLKHVLNHYHAAIAEGGAVLCSAMIHDGWDAREVRRKKGRIIMPERRGLTAAARDNVILRGGHAFALVGYDDDGFLVLNSWGNAWGRFNPVEEHVKRLQDAKKQAVVNGVPDPKPCNWLEGDDLPNDSFFVNGQGGRMRGIAHWSYDDWSRHVMDAWVLRLTAPTRKEAWYSGGFSSAADGAARSGTPRSRNVIGHFIHVKDGKFVKEPPYDNSKETAEDTAAILKERRGMSKKSDRYQHLLFFAHGALNTIESASARAAAMTPVFKRHGIYPVFFFWRTGIGSIAHDILESQNKQIASRANQQQSVINHLLERSISTVGRAIWREIRENAWDSFHIDESVQPIGIDTEVGSDAINGGAAWEATEILLKAALEGRDNPMKVHCVGHSAGALLIGSMLHRMKDDWKDALSSVTLMAPACTVDYFSEAFGETALALKKKFYVHNLHVAGDSSMDKHLYPYGKSLLHLISNAFEPVRGTPIAGLDMYWSEKHKEGLEDLNDEEKRWNSIREAVTYKLVDETLAGEPILHMDFDNSAEIMNQVLARILGKRSIKEGGFAPEEMRDGKF